MKTPLAAAAVDEATSPLTSPSESLMARSPSDGDERRPDIEVQQNIPHGDGGGESSLSRECARVGTRVCECGRCEA